MPLPDEQPMPSPHLFVTEDAAGAPLLNPEQVEQSLPRSPPAVRAVDVLRMHRAVERVVLDVDAAAAIALPVLEGPPFAGESAPEAWPHELAEGA